MPRSAGKCTEWSTENSGAHNASGRRPALALVKHLKHKHLQQPPSHVQFIEIQKLFISDSPHHHFWDQIHQQQQFNLTKWILVHVKTSHVIEHKTLLVTTFQRSSTLIDFKYISNNHHFGVKSPIVTSRGQKSYNLRLSLILSQWKGFFGIILLQ